MIFLSYYTIQYNNEFHKIINNLENNLQNVVQVRSVLNDLGQNIDHYNYSLQLVVHNQCVEYVKRRTMQAETQLDKFDIRQVASCSEPYFDQELINLNRTNQYPDKQFFNSDLSKIQQVFRQTQFEQISNVNCEKILSQIKQESSPLTNLGTDQLNLDIAEEILFIDTNHNTFKYPKNHFNEEHDAKAFIFNLIYQQLKKVTIYVDVSSQNIYESNQLQYILSQVAQQTFNECQIDIYYIANNSIVKMFQNMQSNFFTSHNKLLNQSQTFESSSNYLTYDQIHSLIQQIDIQQQNQTDKSNKTFILTCNQQFVDVISRFSTNQSTNIHRSKQTYLNDIDYKNRIYKVYETRNTDFLQSQNITVYNLQLNASLKMSKSQYQKYIRDILLVEYLGFISAASYFSHTLAATNNNDNQFSTYQVKAILKNGTLHGVIALGQRHNIVVEESVTHRHLYQYQSVFFSSNQTVLYDYHSDHIPYAFFKQQFTDNSVTNKLGYNNKQKLIREYGSLLGKSIMFQSFIMPRIKQLNMIVNNQLLDQIINNIGADLSKTVAVNAQTTQYQHSQGKTMYIQENFVLNYDKLIQVTSQNFNKTMVLLYDETLFFDIAEKKHFNFINFINVVSNKFDNSEVFKSISHQEEDLSKYDQNITIRIPFQHINVYDNVTNQQLKKRSIMYDNQLIQGLQQIKIADLENACPSSNNTHRLDVCNIHLPAQPYYIQINYASVFYIRLFRYVYFLYQDYEKSLYTPMRLCIKSQITQIQVCDKLFADESDFDFYDRKKVHPSLKQRSNFQITPDQFDSQGCNCTGFFSKQFERIKQTGDIEVLYLPDYRSKIKYSKFVNPIFHEYIQEIAEGEKNKPIFHLSNQFSFQDLLYIFQQTNDILYFSDQLQFLYFPNQYSRRNEKYQTNLIYSFERLNCQSSNFDQDLLKLLLKSGVASVSYHIVGGQYCLIIQLNKIENGNAIIKDGDATYQIERVGSSNIYSMHMKGGNISKNFTKRKLKTCFLTFKELQANINIDYFDSVQLYNQIYGNQTISNFYQFQQDQTFDQQINFDETVKAQTYEALSDVVFVVLAIALVLVMLQVCSVTTE